MAKVEYNIDSGGVENMTMTDGNSVSTLKLAKAIDAFNDALYEIDASASFTLNIDYTPVGNEGK